MSTIAVAREDGATWIRFDRPEKRNALDVATVNEVRGALADAEARGPGVVVFGSSTPGMFVAGADIGELVERRAPDALAGINSSLFDLIEAFPWPTVAVIDGPAMGGGCELALACDLRVATDRALFAQPELGLGILAGAGGNWRLAQLVGLGQARRMLYLGDRLDGPAALAAGLIDRLAASDTIDQTATDVVTRMAKQSWTALRLTKLALRQHRPATTSFDTVAQALLFEGDDKTERMNRFLKR